MSSPGSDLPAPPPPRWRKLLARIGRVVLGVVLALVALVFIGGAGLVVLLEVPFAIIFGWILYLLRVLPGVRPNWTAIASSLVVLLLLMTAGDRFFRWLCARMTPPRRWRFRDTIAVLGLVLALFATTMAVTGIGHQVGWLAQGGQPLVEHGWGDRLPQLKAIERCRAMRDALDGEHRFLAAKLPPSGVTFHVVPVRLENGRAAEVLIFPRDQEGLRTRAGILCTATEEQRIGSEDVTKVLAALRSSPGPR